MHCAQLLERRWRREAFVPSARCGGDERRAGGGGHSARDPSTRAALHAGRGGELCELGATRGKRTLVVLDRDRKASAHCPVMKLKMNFIMWKVFIMYFITLLV
jgi:hypothetical protein